MSIYSQSRVKITLSTVLISLSIVIALWLLLFIPDYILFKNNMPILFGTTKVEDVNGVHVITESGLVYYVITIGNNVPELYVFGNKVK